MTFGNEPESSLHIQEEVAPPTDGHSVGTGTRSVVRVRSGGNGPSPQELPAAPAPASGKDLPNGPAAAAAIGAGIAVSSLGVLFTVSHSRSDLSEWLQFKNDVGAVSGLSTMAVIIWLFSWVLLTVVLWDRSIPFPVIAGITLALLALGLVLTTPPIVQRIQL